METTEQVTDEMWEKCKSRFDTYLNSYKELIGAPGVNVNFAISLTFDPLLCRYNSGERTRELYDEMMEVE